MFESSLRDCISTKYLFFFQELTSAWESVKIEPISPVSLFWQREDEDQGSVKHSDLETWRKLSHAHWTTLFGYYNITIAGK